MCVAITVAVCSCLSITSYQDIGCRLRHRLDNAKVQEYRCLLPAKMLHGVKEVPELSSTELTLLAAAINACLIPFAFYTGLRTGKSRRVDEEWLQRQMNRIANLEELEEREKLNKVRMMRSGRNTFRNDAGPNARLMRMRVGPRKKAQKNKS